MESEKPFSQIMVSYLNVVPLIKLITMYWYKYCMFWFIYALFIIPILLQNSKSCHTVRGKWGKVSLFSFIPPGSRWARRWTSRPRRWRASWAWPRRCPRRTSPFSRHRTGFPFCCHTLRKSAFLAGGLSSSVQGKTCACQSVLFLPREHQESRSVSHEEP